METLAPLVKQALEQVPALTVVAVLLYFFLKAFEKVISKLIVTQDELRKLYLETLGRYENSMDTIAAVVKDLGTIAGNMKDYCPVNRTHRLGLDPTSLGDVFSAPKHPPEQ